MNTSFKNLFEKFKQLDNFAIFNTAEFLMSGTSAIEFAVRDIMAKHPEIKKAYLPSYRCYCIDLPFVDNKIEILNYEVKYDESNKKLDIVLPDMNDCILFCCDFFIHTDVYAKILKECQCRDKNIKIIYDITHTLLCDSLNLNGADYVIASLRKWFRTTDGGIVFSTKKFAIKALNVNRKYLFYKKMDYLLVGKSKIVQNLKNWAEHQADIQADEHYHGHSLSKKTAKLILKKDFQALKEKRRQNAKCIASVVEQESLLHLQEKTLLAYPFIDTSNNRQDKIDMLRACGVRCANFWNDTNFKFEQNICFDLNQDLSSETYKRIKDILGR